MMFKIEMYVDGQWWAYGTYTDRNKANEVAITVRDERDVNTRVVEC